MICVSRAFLVGSEVPEVNAVSGDRGDHEAEGDHPEQASQAAAASGLQCLDQRREQIKSTV